MKPNASLLAVLSAVSLAALTGITSACSPSPSPASLGTDTISASPTQAPNSPSLTTPTAPVTPTAQPLKPPSDQTPAANNRTVESCVTKMAIVDDPNPPLNVRSVPTTDGDNVVGQLKNGTLVMVAEEQNGWFQIKSPQKGWISKSQTANGCNEKVERISLSTNGAALQIADRFIGTGNHRYVVAVDQPQTLTLTRGRGPFPMVMAPDGTVLLGHDAADEKRSTWSGRLTQTGDYVVELESNFRGYRYAFSMELK